MICLGLALACGIRCRFRKDIRMPGPVLLTLACITAAWFAIRAITSPVAEHGLADLLLLAAAVGAFCWIRTIDGNARAQRVFHWGVLSVLAANLVVMYLQWKDPSFIPLFHSKPSERMITGFFNHYIEASHFLVTVSLWTAAAAIWGPHRTATKILFLLVSLAGLLGVTFTGGRGGIAGGTAGLLVFFFLLLIQAKNSKAKWFAPAVIAVPLLAAAAALYLFFGLQTAQQMRGSQQDAPVEVTRMLDNNARLFAITIALECIARHPFTGGGARSFSWESHQFTDPTEYGLMAVRRLEFVHNEFLQAASDYGMVGAILIFLLLIAFGMNCVIRTMFNPAPSPPDPADALRLGGLAALAAITTQACFAFSIHLIPGAILLGACLGMISQTGPSTGKAASALPMRITLAVPAFAAMALLLWCGFTGTMATRTLWKSEYSKFRHLHQDVRADNLTSAISWWPHSSLHEQRGILLLAGADSSAPDSKNFLRKSISAFESGARLHPYEPMFAVHLGHAHSLADDNREAESWFNKAITLQGKQEPAFRAHLTFARHYFRLARRQFTSQGPAAAIPLFAKSVEQIETATRKMHWPDRKMHDFRILAHEMHGFAQESNHDLQGALEAYRFASKIQYAQHIHYRLAVVLGKIADQTWQQREPEQALALYLQARQHLDQSSGQLPADVSADQRQKYLEDLDHNIAFLRGAKVEPAE